MTPMVCWRNGRGVKSMTTEEQIRIIRNWSQSFRIRRSGEYYHGVLFIRWDSSGGIMGPHDTIALVTSEAYKLVQDVVWKEVVECGR